MKPGNKGKNRAQLEYSADPVTLGTLREPFFLIFKEIRRPQAITIPSGATSFEVRGEVMEVTAGGACTIATIIGGYEGQELVLIFTDTNVTITDTTFAVGTPNTVNLSAAFTSTANDTMKLVYKNLSWFELSRSTN